MKQLFYILTAVMLVSAVSCDNASTKKEKEVSTNDENSSKKIEIKYLEDFMQFDNQDQIADYFGENNIHNTIIYEEEGTVKYNVTIVNSQYTNSITLYWETDNDLEHIKIAKNAHSNYTYDGNEAIDGGEVYPTHVGLELGMSLPEIQKINGSAFTFYGLAWDYGGFVNELDAKFNDYRLFVGHTDPNLFTNCPDEYYNIIGDSEFSSENEDALKLGLELVSISYMKEQNN